MAGSDGKSPSASGGAFPAPRLWLVALLILLPVAAVYWQVGGHGFVNWDDQLYVAANPHVRNGLTLEGVRWAFTTSYGSLRHPLTWISHMMDVTLFGLDPGWHHRVSVLFHMANAALLFLVLHSMTGALWRSGFVAALFAIHPLHVESVAWVADRKDVLSTMFWLLTTAAYVRYARLPGVLRGAFVVLPFALGLLCKPMLVTLPFTLLLLDYWPLGRWRPGGGPAAAAGTHPGSTVSRLVVEKIPLLALSAAVSVAAYRAVEAGGSEMTSWGSLPAGWRIGNAIVSYAAYLGKTVWPASLSPIYPVPAVPAAIPAWKVAAALLALGGISALALRMRIRRPWLVAGWLWFLGTLVPVLGLIRFWAHAMADRYTYVPLIGIFIAAAWGLSETARRYRIPRLAAAAAGGAIVLALSMAAWRQAGYWANGVALFGRAVEVTENNWVAHNNLGESLAARGDVEGAAAHFREAIRIRPAYAAAHNNLGGMLLRRGRVDEAAAEFREAIRINPAYAAAHSNLGLALAKSGKLDGAIVEFREALRLDPEFADAHRYLVMALSGSGGPGAAPPR